MKILMVTDTYPPNVNGAAIATQRLAEGLAEKGHLVSIVAPSTSFKYFKTIQKNITIYRVKSVPILIEKTQDIRISPKILHEKEMKEIIDEIQPDIIHINEPWLLGLSAINIAKPKHIPIISTHHFMPENLIHHLRLPEKIEKMINRSVWMWYGKLCKKLDLVICPTESAREILLKYNKGVDLKVISNGIDLQKFNPSNNNTYLKKRFNLPDSITFLFVGRLDKEKNADVLIRALARIKDNADYHAVIVGQGKEKMSLQKLAEELHISSRITFTGYLQKKYLPDMYRMADVFVMPGIAELQSLVTMEAMASGLPVIGANAVALPHLIHDNQNGFLFQPGNDEELAEKIVKLLHDKQMRKRMGEISLKIIKQHDIRQSVIKVENTYNQVITKNKTATVEKKVDNTNVLASLKKINLKKIIFQELQI